MTKAEAIKALEIELNKCEAHCKSYHAVKEALLMGIESLKNENALIDRVLEIIDAHLQSTHNRLNTFESPFVDEWIRCKKEVLALKGGEKE